MANLLKEFFKRDLTDAEWQTLGRQLDASPGDAMRFAKLAKKFYLNLGLPNPGAPGGSPGLPPPVPPGLILEFLVIAAVVGGISWFIWKSYHTPPAAKAHPKAASAHVKRQPALHPKLIPAPRPTPPPTPTPRPRPAPAVPTPRPRVLPSQPPKPLAPLAPAAKPPPLPTARPAFTPTPDDSPGGLFQNGYKGQDVHQ
jgi:hypothetical protein